MTSFTITVRYNGTSHTLSTLSPDSSLADLQLLLEDLTSVPPSHQKLIFKGKKAGTDTSVSLHDLGIKNGMKLQMLGTTAATMEQVTAAATENERRASVMKARALKAPVKVSKFFSSHGYSVSLHQLKVRNTGSSSFSNISYRFHSLKPLSHLPKPDSALTILQRLSSDEAILHIMQQHEFSVGVLTELAPHEHPNLLGLNVNAGEQIKLRIRTDKYDGFRNYKEIRKVLCHELTHNVWGDHDQNVSQPTHSPLDTSLPRISVQST